MAKEELMMTGESEKRALMKPKLVFDLGEQAMKDTMSGKVDDAASILFNGYDFVVWEHHSIYEEVVAVICWKG